jgi:hypothetical protein
MYGMIYCRWELLDDDGRSFTRFYLQSFCEAQEIPEDSLQYHLTKLLSGPMPLLSKRSYYKSVYFTFTNYALDCVDIAKIKIHIGYAAKKDRSKLEKDALRNYFPHPLFLQWHKLSPLMIKQGGEMKSLVDLSTGKDIKQKTWSDWSEDLVKEICQRAHDQEAKIDIGKGELKNVFAHLSKSGDFNKRRAGIDKACMMIDDILSGRFWRDHVNLFGNIPESVLRFKNTDRAVERAKLLQGDKDHLRKFILKCVDNYFIAIQPGMDTYRDVKSSFPKNIQDFFFSNDYQCQGVANFLLYYSSTLTAKDLNIEDRYNQVADIVGDGKTLEKLLDYTDLILPAQYLSFWLNVYRMCKEIKTLIRTDRTSYDMDFCFTIIFDNVDKLYERYGTIKAGYFDPKQSTGISSLVEMRRSKGL